MTLFTIFTAVGGFVMGWAEVSLRDVRIWWESFPNATHYAIILLFSTSAGMYLYFLFNNYVPKVEVKWIKVNKSSN